MHYHHVHLNHHTFTYIHAHTYYFNSSVFPYKINMTGGCGLTHAIGTRYEIAEAVNRFSSLVENTRKHNQ